VSEQDEVVTCEYCTNDADGVTINNDAICNDCSRTCDGCSNVFHNDDDDFTHVDGDLWCESCVSHHANYCVNCEEWTSGSTNYVQDRDDYWCEGCINYNAEWCDICEVYNRNSCQTCSDETDGNGNRVIHDYSYRPDAIFYSVSPDERLYFGLELEMEFNGQRREAATYAYQQLETINYAYLKNDGSLDDGFELVTHPMSYEFLMDMETSRELWDTIAKLRDTYGARSYNTRTCGFHIHISRTGFNGGAHMHRFLNLVYSNPQFYSKLAGRRSDQWAKFDDVYRRHYDPATDSDKLVKSFKDKLSWSPRYGNDSDRYSAINTRNQHTLEMRIFKGTMSIQALKAHIQLAHASVEYTRNLTIKDVNNGAYHPDKFVAYIYANHELYPYLIGRIQHKELALPMAEPPKQDDPTHYPPDQETAEYYERLNHQRWVERQRLFEEQERRANPTDTPTSQLADWEQEILNG